MLEKKVLSEQIKEKIMESILNGELKPGERLIESSLAKEYGVSQAPVREAIRSLQALHLVQIVPYKGTVVRKYTKKDLEEFFVVRSCLEGLAGRIAATACTQKDIDELQRILDEMIEAAHQGDYTKRTEQNEKFHKKLVEASKNSILIETAENLRLNSWSKVTGTHTKMDPRDIANRHQESIDLLKARDAAGLEQAMIRHVRDSFAYFEIDTLPQYGEESAQS